MKKGNKIKFSFNVTFVMNLITQNPLVMQIM